MSYGTPLPSVRTKTISSPAPNGMGTGLFASLDIRTGEDILKISSPFVAVLDTPRLTDTCSGCFGKRQAIADQSVDLKACTGCQVVKYCDKVGALLPLIIPFTKSAGVDIFFFFARPVKPKTGNPCTLLSVRSFRNSHLEFFPTTPGRCSG